MKAVLIPLALVAVVVIYAFRTRKTKLPKPEGVRDVSDK